ncbi:glycosyl transferase [Christiangramia fulva]|uniref:Glycosyl transferase n=1 Tax=Christiangramia fulva TaxID=2126553 RepID=A0A2R3Z3L5_9FLAO|nr:glycosyltransferase family 2 protein [Christiangramia fulva]AVR44854.1 glycosyl transferase [Christiangramia fulva]
MEDYGKVSVIMPAYNSGKFIGHAIDSVIAQTYENWELLIVDDASTDDTREIIQNKLNSDQRIQLFHHSTNLGTQYSRNKAIEKAAGRFIAFLDADDLWIPEKLEIQLKTLHEQNFQACFSSYDLIDEKGRSLGKTIKALPKLNFQKLLKANYVGNLTGIYDTRKIGKIFCPDIAKRQDWALWLEVIRKGGPITGIQQSLAKYRVRKNSISRNKFAMLNYNFRVYHHVLGYGYLHSCWRMLIFLKEQFFIKSKQEISNEPEK